MNINERMQGNWQLQSRLELLERQDRMMTALERARRWLPANEDLFESAEAVLGGLARAMVENCERLWELSSKLAGVEVESEKPQGKVRDESLPF